MILVKITKFSLTQNAMPGSNNFQLFLGSSLLTFFMKTKFYYNYGFDAYFLWHHVNGWVSPSRQDMKWLQDFSQEILLLESWL